MKRPSLATWIFIGMAVGVAVGVAAPGFAQHLDPISHIFLSLIRAIIAPLIFASLVYGIAGSGDLKQMGRIGLKAIVYFEIVTTLALFLGLAVVNLSRPGEGVSLTRSAAEAALPAAQSTFKVENMVPTSIFDALARNDALQIVVFAFLFGAACAAIGAKADPVVKFCGSLAEVMYQFTWYVMYLAPFGVGAAIAVTIGSKGIGVMFGLGKLILAMYGSAVLCILVVLLPSIWIFRIPLGRFCRAVREPFVIGFSTASGAAALPLALENMEQFGVPKHIVSFVIPIAYNFNLVGAAVYLSVAAIFVAQAGGQHLTIGTQLAIMLALMLTSKGLAGIPRAALVILAGTLATFHLPMEGVAVLLGVDAVLDMARSGLNVLGNCLASAVVARWEGYKL
jgi:proton glutamate symport protein